MKEVVEAAVRCGAAAGSAWLRGRHATRRPPPLPSPPPFPRFLQQSPSARLSRMGYRHIDCAAEYENEGEVGETLAAVLADGTVRREGEVQERERGGRGVGGVGSCVAGVVCWVHAGTTTRWPLVVATREDALQQRANGRGPTFSISPHTSHPRAPHLPATRAVGDQQAPQRGPRPQQGGGSLQVGADDACRQGVGVQQSWAAPMGWAAPMMHLQERSTTCETESKPRGLPTAPLCMSRESLSRLGLDHLDLYLMHWPVTGRPGPAVDPPLSDTWRAMEGLVRSGLARWVWVNGGAERHGKQLQECGACVGEGRGGTYRQRQRSQRRTGLRIPA